MSLRSTRCSIFVALLAWATLPLAAQTASTGQSNTDINYVQPSVAGSSAPAPAPDTGETKPAEWEIFAGYSWINSNSTVNGTTIPFGTSIPIPVSVKLKDAREGFVIDISYFANRWFGFTFDTGAHWGDRYNTNEIMAGPTIRFPAEHIQPFIHVLFGWDRLSPSDNNTHDAFGLIAGGGIDLKVARHFNLRLAQADYLYSRHNYSNTPKNVDFVRLSAGVVLLAGVGEELPTSATCSVDKSEVWAGEPVKASAAPHNFNPKHTLNYNWTTNGGKVQGTGDTVTVDTTGIAEGQSYNISVQVSDPRNKKAVTSCQTAFATRKRLPPTIACSANPNPVVQGGSVTIHSDASSPQGGPVTVAVSSDCGISGQGADVSVDTSSLQPATCNITCNVTDDHQLTASSTTNLTIQPKPIIKPPEPPLTLVLRSVYFATAQPTPRNPNGGLVRSQESTLTQIADDFVKYLAKKPDAKLVLEAHADPRGGVAYNEKLTERRATRVKSFLVEHGVPADSLETRPLGIQHQLTPDEVRKSMDDDPTLTPGERKRLERNMRLIVLAANRRVDLKLEGPGIPEQLSQRQYPFAAADALSLIGGRERPKPKAPVKAPAKKRPARKSKK